jgi:hypothetical protein
MSPPDAEQSLLEAVSFLVTAWRNLSAYPAGHPARMAAIESAQARLASFMAVSGRLVLGVARDGLLYGEKKLDSPNVKAFAEALYRRNAALLYVEESVAAADLESLLRLLGETPGRGERAPIGDELRAEGIERITISSIDYTRLVTTDELVGRESRPAGSLWDTLIQALLTGKRLTRDGTAPLPGETYSAAGIVALLAATSAAGGGAPRAETPGGGITSGAVLAAAASDYLTRARGRDKEVAVHQVAELLRALPSEVREPLLASALRTLDAEPDAPTHVQNLTGSLAPDEVLQSLRRLNAEGVRLSPHALRMIQTLAAAREKAAPGRVVEVGADLAQVSALFADEDVDRYNPDDHRTLLAQVAAVDLMTVALPSAPAPDIVGDEVDTLTEDAVDASLADTLFDLAAAYPDTAPPFVIGRLRTLFLRALDETRFERALAIVRGVRAFTEAEGLTSAQRAGRAQLVENLTGAFSLSSLLASAGTPDNLTLSQVQALVTELGPAAARSLLAALTVESDRTRRFQLFDLAASLGLAVVPEATRLLADSRWFVVRNMIVLLRKVGDRTSLGEIQRCAEDPDPRVGLEAIITLLAFESEISRDLLARAIHNPDPKFAEAAIVLTGQYGIVEAIDPLVEILRRWDPFGTKRSLRLKALRALKALKTLPETEDPEVLAKLERYFRQWRIPPVHREERRAAFRLLEAYPEETRAPYVRRGRRSRDPVIRAICERLERAPAPRPGPPPAAPASPGDER